MLGPCPTAPAAPTAPLPRCLTALLAKRYSAEIADEADEGSALGAGVSFRGPLLLATGAASHCVVLLGFSHGGSQEVMLYRLILLISVAREMPSSIAARVRFPL